MKQIQNKLKKVRVTNATKIKIRDFFEQNLRRRFFDSTVLYTPDPNDDDPFIWPPKLPWPWGPYAKDFLDLRKDRLDIELEDVLSDLLLKATTQTPLGSKTEEILSMIKKENIAKEALTNFSHNLESTQKLITSTISRM